MLTLEFEAWKSTGRKVARRWDRPGSKMLTPKLSMEKYREEGSTKIKEWGRRNRKQISEQAVERESSTIRKIYLPKVGWNFLNKGVSWKLEKQVNGEREAQNENKIPAQATSCNRRKKDRKPRQQHDTRNVTRILHWPVVKVAINNSDRKFIDTQLY